MSAYLQTVAAHFCGMSRKEYDIRKKRSSVQHNPSAAMARKSSEKSDGIEPNDRDLLTRDASIVGLILAWGASLSTLATGIIILVFPTVTAPDFLMDRMAKIGPTSFVWATGQDATYLAGHWAYNVDESAMVMIPLLIQVVVSLVSACLGSIHATTLRWALWHEGRLRHNASLRLFTSSKKRGPNSWMANTVAIVGLVLTNGGAAVMTFPISVIAILDLGLPDASKDPFIWNLDSVGNRYGLDFNGWGLTGLGAGLLLQTIISTWALIDCGYVGTWNPNPLATARACRVLRGRRNETAADWPLVASEPAPSFSSRPTIPLAKSKSNSKPDVGVTVEDGEHTTTATRSGSEQYSEPMSTQPSPLSLFPAIRTLANCIWGVSAILSIMVLVIAIRASKPHATYQTAEATTSIAFVQGFVGHSDAWYVWQFFGMVESVYNVRYWQGRGEWIGLLIETAVLIPLIFGLHVAELLSQLGRDEMIWRRAATVGANPDANVILEGVRHWSTYLVFIYRFTVPWVAGFAVACNRNVYFNTLPTLTLTVMFLLLGLMAELLTRAQPKGSQPSVYGDVKEIAALVDDWGHKKIFWGDKGVYEGDIRLAGTAGRRLADLKPGCLYVGLSREMD